MKGVLVFPAHLLMNLSHLEVHHLEQVQDNHQWDKPFKFNENAQHFKSASRTSVLGLIGKNCQFYGKKIEQLFSRFDGFQSLAIEKTSLGFVTDKIDGNKKVLCDLLSQPR